MGSPELGRVIPVNFTEKAVDLGLEVAAAPEAYRPRVLDPTTTRDHEAIHAGLGSEGEVELVSIIPGPGYRGITRFKRPNALAAMGPHSVGARGTGWDVKVAHHIHGGGSLESSARHAVHENHAAIVEIGDELGQKRVLSGREVDAARKRAQMKMKYGEKATVIARSRTTGEEIRVNGVKVDGDKTTVPEVVFDFSARLRQRQEAEKLEKAKLKDSKQVTSRLEAVREELLGLQAA